MFCGYCGKQAAPDDRFCAGCGRMLTEPLPPPPVPVAVYTPPRRSAAAAACLALFFGGLGVHNFYLGQNGRGIAKVLVSVLLALPTLFVAPLAMHIWALAEVLPTLSSIETNC